MASIIALAGCGGALALPAAKSPIAVCYAGSDDRRESFELALEFWNLERGERVLVDSCDGDPILVTEGECRHGGCSDPRVGLIRLDGAMDPFVAYKYIAHELGHVAFKLGHSTYGIMSPDAQIGDAFPLDMEHDPLRGRR